MKAEKGVTLIEVMGALAVLAVGVVGTLTAVQMAGVSNSISRERTRAFEAAQEMIAEIRDAPNFNAIVSTYGNSTFPVDFYVEHSRLLPGDPRPMGIGGVEEGEVVIVRDEDPVGANYGRDLDGDGVPDGVDLGGIFPLDLNADGDATDSGIAAADMQIMPVYVIVRWQTLGGPGGNRVQMCTFIARKK